MRTPAKTYTADNTHAPCGTRLRYASTRQCVHCHRAKMRAKGIERYSAAQSQPAARDPVDHSGADSTLVLDQLKTDTDIGDLI